MTAPNPGLGSAFFVLLLIVLLVVRRTIRLVSGTRYSPPRMFAFAGLYLALFAGFGFATIYAAEVSWGTVALLLVPVYAAVVVAAAGLALGYIERIVQFESRPDGRWYYRLPYIVPILSLALFVARFGAEVWAFGLSAVGAFAPPSSVPAGILGVLIAVDLLFGISVGLMLARAAGVYRAFRARAASALPAASPPLPDP